MSEGYHFCVMDKMSPVETDQTDRQSLVETQWTNRPDRPVLNHLQQATTTTKTTTTTTTSNFPRGDQCLLSFKRNDFGDVEEDNVFIDSSYTSLSEGKLKQLKYVIEWASE